ncbi:MAG TPA: DUF86 domain-containing protein [Atribacterota bacterium]|nr:DUF86 domain-containing protein [Atribacterota bacterium]
MAPFKEKRKEEFLRDEYLQDIVERNLEVAIQSCIDIANRIISLDGLEKPRDYYGAIIRLGEENILPYDFTQNFAPVAGFRNILIHEYLEINWDEVYRNLKQIDQFYKFMEYIEKWLAQRT